MFCISQIKVSILALRVCLDFISSLVEKYFRGDLVSLIAANSGLFARAERSKIPKRISNKRKSRL